jgi:hypothetical protein
MTNSDLHEKIAELHQQLQASPQLDAATVASLKQLMADISDVVSVEARAPGQVPDLRSRLREIIEQFEGEHPKLTVALSQVSEFLASIGI